MPSLGADMDEGTLLEWLVHPGDVVHKGDIVAVVDTAKAAVEVECFDTGVINELLVEPGTRVPVGATSGHASPPSDRGTRAATSAAPPACPRRRTGPARSRHLVRRLATARHVTSRLVRAPGLAAGSPHADVDRAAPPHVHRAGRPEHARRTPAPTEPGAAGPRKASP